MEFMSDLAVPAGVEGKQHSREERLHAVVHMIEMTAGRCPFQSRWQLCLMRVRTYRERHRPLKFWAELEL